MWGRDADQSQERIRGEVHHFKPQKPLKPMKTSTVAGVVERWSSGGVRRRKCDETASDFFCGVTRSVSFSAASSLASGS